MAFVNIQAFNVVPANPYIKLKWTPEGGCRGYLGKDVDIRGKFIMEIDEAAKVLRVRQATKDEKGAINVDRKQSRNFCLPKLVMKAIDNEDHIPLTLKDGGWWYGYFGKEEGWSVGKDLSK